MNKINKKKLVISLILPQFAGAIGSLFTVSSVSTWYSQILKPSFNPPSWIFGPVWILLYVLMGIGIYLIWMKKEEGREEVKIATNLFWIHLIFNSTWSILFFGLQSPILGLMNILVLWVFIAILIERFLPISKIASYLLIPYFLWVSFATILNYYIWILN